MELRDYLATGRTWLWLFALSTAVAAVGAWVGTRFMPNTYKSSTTLMVGRALDNPDVSAQTIYLSNQLATTYAQMSTREQVLQGVVDALELPVAWQQLRGMIKAQPQPGTPLFEISVVATDPELVRALAAATGEQVIAQSGTSRLKAQQQDAGFLQGQIDKLQANIVEAQDEIDGLQDKLDTATSARQISELQSQQGAREVQLNEWRARYVELRSQLEGSDVNALSIIEEATPGFRVGPNVGMNVLLAALLGFGLALLAVLAIEYLDDTIKTPELVQRRLGLPGLAAVNRLADIKQRSDALVTANAPRSPMAETYRSLRTNISFALLQREDGPLIVSSAQPGEGKSTTAANLAVVFAQTGRRVVLVDGDLRRPSLHRFFGLANNRGLTTLMLDSALEASAMLYPVDGQPNLSVLTSGPLPPNPSEILASERCREVLAELVEQVDMVIVDSPPVLLVTDPVVLALRSAGILLVFDAGRTRMEAARKTVETLERAGIRPLGVVVNQLDAAKAGGYYRDAYYNYQQGYSDYYGEMQAGEDGGPPQERHRVPPQVTGLRQRLAAALAALMS
jgi:non-specific protein-tyrosine kinase